MNVVPESIEAAGGRAVFVSRPGGIRLRAAVFNQGGTAGRCLFLTGYTEFVEKSLETVGELTVRGFEVATLDWRGQGLSSRLLPDRHKGHIDRMETHLEDLDAVLETLSGYSGGPLTLFGHSMGGHLALRFLQDRADRVGRAILVAPMLGIAGRGMMHPLTRRLVALLRSVGLGSRYIPGGSGYGPRRRRFEGNRLTGDAQRFARLHRLIDRHPELALADPTIAWAAAAFRSIEQVNAPGALERLTVPILLALAEHESIVSNAAIEAAAARLPSARLIRFADARHEILGETEKVRAAFWREVDGFLKATGPVTGQEVLDDCAPAGNP